MCDMCANEHVALLGAGRGRFGCHFFFLARCLHVCLVQTMTLMHTQGAFSNWNVFQANRYRERDTHTPDICVHCMYVM